MQRHREEKICPGRLESRRSVEWHASVQYCHEMRREIRMRLQPAFNFMNAFLYRNNN